jgi:23S rRNA pseudouridine2605 synthase
LQKILAAAGVCSRRKAEELIQAGRVQVNGKIVTELGTKADSSRDHIRVDGKLLHGAERPRYYVVNKPKGYVTTASDPQNRPTVMQLIRGGERVFPVGRLDYASEGLLLLTNDGAMAQKLMHASSHVSKTYLVKVSGRPSDEGLQKLRRGIMLPPLAQSQEGKPRPSKTRPIAVKTAPAKIELVRDATNPWYEITLIEGRTRQIRRMFEEIGHHVEKIKRVRYGPLTLDVEPGRFRMLTQREVAKLKGAGREQGKLARRRSSSP